jgi:hypothetical protein
MKWSVEQASPGASGAAETPGCLVTRGPRRRVALLGVVVAIAIAACSSGDESNDDAAASPLPATAASAQAAEFELPEREGPRRETTGDVPHIQLDAEPNPTVDAELRRRASLLPGILDLPSDRSLPGARGLAFGDDVDLARPDVIDGSSEFAHIHPDGSLHVWLPVDSAQEVDETKWGEIHPWADRDGFWPGVVMVYTPETLDELDIALRIVVDAYNFVTGASVTVAEIS